MAFKYVNGELVEMSVEEEAATTAQVRAGRRQDLRQALDAAYQARLLQGLSLDGLSFALDEASQRRITSAYNLAQDSKTEGGIAWPEGFAWRSNSNAYRPLPTADDMIAFARAASTEAVRLQFTLFTRKDTLAAMPDEELEGFDPAAGWD